MKKLIVLLVVLLPVGVMAQEGDSKPEGSQESVASLEVLTSTPAGDLREVLLGLSKFSGLEYPPGPGLDPPQLPKRRPSKRAEESSRPRSEGSMVGYIDNAIVGSEVRVRFDAAFNDKSPDLAEFFYGKCGCYRTLGGIPGAPYDPNAPGPPPGATTPVIPKTLNFQQLYFNLEYAPHPRFSAFVEVPFRWLQAQGLVVGAPGSFPNQGGISDVRAGFKFAVLASYNHYLTFQLKSYFPTGDASQGLGTNHYSIEPVVLYYQRIGERTAIESQVGDWHPIGGSAGVPTTSSQKFAGDVFFYGVGPSYDLYRGEQVRFSPVVELFGWHIVSGLETAGPTDASGMNIVNIKLGARTSVGVHNSFYAGYGRALTTGLWWYKNILRLEYRYAF